MAQLWSQPAYLLHARPYRETSLLLTLLTPDEGKLGLVAKGARRPQSRQRSLLQPFLPLQINYSGRASLRNLQSVEANGLPAHLQGRVLISGLYLNELLVRLLAEGEPQPRLFVTYAWALQHLAEEGALEAVLRRFEKELLAELGFALNLSHCVEGQPLQAQSWYQFDPQQGLQRLASGAHNPQYHYPGWVLLALAEDDYQQPQVRRLGKILLRQALQPHLGEKPLHSRLLFQRPGQFS
ncbi:DNA repair protein RecO [Balneatrix alpica]|uniref:DNA repair protein RecO n=1 Tax=Balneatrix alpica TaxID=75684 RepID=A0ABV5Z9G6_9GAMM|nr:DNA repair protein RecO [Balneatrix alpica]